MAIEQICLSITAVAMLFMACAGSGIASVPPTDVGHRTGSNTAPEKQIPRVEGEIVQIDARERKIYALIEREPRILEAGESTPVVKDRKEGGLELLARGDQVMFFLAAAGSTKVTRIEAIPTH